MAPFRVPLRRWQSDITTRLCHLRSTPSHRHPACFLILFSWHGALPATTRQASGCSITKSFVTERWLASRLRRRLPTPRCRREPPIPNEIYAFRSTRQRDVTANADRDDAPGRGHRPAAHRRAAKRELLGRGGEQIYTLSKNLNFLHPDDCAATAFGADDSSQPALQLPELAGFGLQLAIGNRHGVWIRLDATVRIAYSCQNGGYAGGLGPAPSPRSRSLSVLLDARVRRFTLALRLTGSHFAQLVDQLNGREVGDLAEVRMAAGG